MISLLFPECSQRDEEMKKKCTRQPNCGYRRLREVIVGGGVFSKQSAWGGNTSNQISRRKH